VYLKKLRLLYKLYLFTEVLFTIIHQKLLFVYWFHSLIRSDMFWWNLDLTDHIKQHLQNYVAPENLINLLISRV